MTKPSKINLIDRDYFRRPGLYKDYHEMMKAIPFRATTDYYQQQHSEFEKPYLDGIFSYERMQHLWPKTFDPFYLRIEDSAPDIYQAGGVGAGGCAENVVVDGTVDGIVPEPWYEMDCFDPPVEIGMLNGVAPIEASGVGSSNGSIAKGVVDEGTEDEREALLYSPPDCTGCCDDIFDNIEIIDACGRRVNVIIKVICDRPEAPFEIQTDMVQDPTSSSNALISTGTQFWIDGGTVPFTWSIDCGTLAPTNETGNTVVWADDSCCGEGTISVVDGCGEQATMSFRYPGGSWSAFALETNYCANAPTSNFTLYFDSFRRKYTVYQCTADLCANPGATDCNGVRAVCAPSCGPSICGHPYNPFGGCTERLDGCDDEPCQPAICRKTCIFITKTEISNWECP